MYNSKEARDHSFFYPGVRALLQSDFARPDTTMTGPELGMGTVRLSGCCVFSTTKREDAGFVHHHLFHHICAESSCPSSHYTASSST